MSQGVLPYSFESAGAKRRATSRAGLCPYLELACVCGLLKSIRDNVPIGAGEQGYTAEQIVMALISLNLADGQCEDDLQILESDDGFGRVFRMAERYHLYREERRAFEKRFRKGRKRNTPSPSVVFRFLAKFHDAEQEKLRKDATAFIPKANEALLGLMKVNADLVAFMQGRHPEKTATLEMDATIVRTYKRDALYSYKGDKSYQPHNVYWGEQDMLLYSEFRDGNVPAWCWEDRWTRRRMKALRFHLIDVAGTLLNHAGLFVVKLNVTADIFRKLQDIRRIIYALKASAPR